MNLKKMSKKTKRYPFIITALFVGAISIYVTLSNIQNYNSLAGEEFLLFAVTIINLCLIYLYPHFVENDERTKMIKQKGIFFSWFFAIGYLLAFVILIGIGSLETYFMVCVLIASIVVTPFLIFVFLSQRY